MKATLKIISWMALAGIVCLSAGYFFSGLSLEHVKPAMLICAVVWFATAPFWMEHRA